MGTPGAITVSAGFEPTCEITGSATTTTYTTSASNGTGYNWSVSNALAGTIDPVTGVMTWANGFYGSVSIEVTANGCNGPSAMTTRTVTLTQNVPVSVSIVASATEVCSGKLVTFTATPENGGSTPSYQWKVNNVNAGTNSATYAYSPANGDVVTCVLTSNVACTSGNPATSNQIAMTVNPNLPVSVTISRDASIVCAGTVVNFTATATNGGLAPVYQWKVNGTSAGTNSSTFAYAPANLDVVRCVVTSSETCTSNNPATSDGLTMTVNPVLPVSLTIAASANPVCIGTSVTFSATPVNGGLTPAYQWKRNGQVVTGATNSTYAVVPANNDIITCSMTSSLGCPSVSPAVSNAITMSVTPLQTVSVTIVASANPSCTGSQVTFTATPVNGGSSPVYNWRKNDGRIGTNSPTLTYVPANGDRIYCLVTSNASCIASSQATSNTITMAVSAPVAVSVSIGASANNVCQGTPVIFTANPVNGGTSPSYQWKVNSANVDGATSSVFTYAPQNNDVVSCVLISSILCTTGNPATSNAITMTVVSVLPVSVSIEASGNPVEHGNPVTFTATGVNAGPSPVYQWYRNGSPAGMNSTTFSYNPSNGDEVYCTLISDAPCAPVDPVTSNTITMVVTVPVSVTLTGITVQSGETECYDATGTITVGGSDSYFIVMNGGSATMIAGNNIIYLPGTEVRAGGYMHGYISTQFCGAVAPAIMANLTTGESELPVVMEKMSFRIYPNPTNGNFTLEQKGNSDFRNVRVEVYSMTGEPVLTGEIIGQKKQEFMFSDVPAGLYFVKVISGSYVETIKLIKSR